MRKKGAGRVPHVRVVDRGRRALQGGKEKRVHWHLPPRQGGATVEERASRVRTSYHHLALDFKLGVLTGILEKEIDVADHGERFNIFVCELDLARHWLQRTREDNERKF